MFSPKSIEPRAKNLHKDLIFPIISGVDLKAEKVEF